MKVIKCPVSKDEASFEKDCASCPGIAEACKVLDAMGLVVYPTDTVYGLACLALYPEAVDKVYRVKGRPVDSPITVTVSGPEGLLELTSITPEQAKFLGRLTGEPITWVLPALDIVPKRLLAGGRTLGVRILSKGCAAAIVDRVGPITATSANVHGRRSARKVEDAVAALGEAVDIYLDCGKTPIGIPSTVAEVVFDGEKVKVKSIRIIREGSIGGEALKEMLKAKPKLKKKPVPRK
jgi:L-threonylcarbamoyladenylate synthase